MIRPALTEIGIFLIPFVVYAFFLIATRSGLLLQSSWPLRVITRLAIGALLLVIVSFILLAHFSGAPPDSTYIPAHIENGKFVPGTEKFVPGAEK
jgi:phosphoglycerol transferase MdoB-like AlkP superfamily enzyme